jgi:hypothetical protein
MWALGVRPGEPVVSIGFQLGAAPFSEQLDLGLVAARRSKAPITGEERS